MVGRGRERGGQRQDPERERSTSRVGVGLVGLGRAAAAMLPSILLHPRFELRAAATIDPEQRERFADDLALPAYGSIDELCADETVEAVYIATPHDAHTDQACYAVEHGRHVLVEKPMCLTVADSKRIVSAAKRGGVVVMVGHTHGCDPLIMAMRDVIGRRDFGRLRMVWSLNFTDFLRRPRRPEDLDAASGGGVLYNQLSHQVDVVRTLEGDGKISAVRAFTGSWDLEKAGQCAYTALLFFASGAVANVTYNGSGNFDSDRWMSMISETGHRKTRSEGRAVEGGSGRASPSVSATVPSRIPVSRELLEARSAPPDAQAHFGPLIATLDEADLVLRPDGIEIVSRAGVQWLGVERPEGEGSKARTLDEFWRAIRLGEPIVHSAAWGAHTVASCLAVHASTCWGREVRVGDQRASSPKSIVEAVGATKP